MTKKEFVEQCDFHVYTGWSGKRIKHNVIYFDYKQTDEGRGFKYAVAMNIEDGTKAELTQHLYDWIFNGTNLPWYVRYKYAESDAQRFKVGLSLNW
jgi:hypothetical protein